MERYRLGLGIVALSEPRGVTIDTNGRTLVGESGGGRVTLFDASGHQVLQFGEPPDYLPRERWLETLGGRPLDDELWPGRGVRRVTGATLTVQALTSAVRRGLALEALLLRGATP